MKHLTALLASALLVCACGSSDPEDSSLDDRDNVRAWANTISAVAVWSYVHGPIAHSDGRAPFGDPSCPSVADDGTTLEISGGCTDDAGNEWVGTATIVRTGQDRALVLDGWGQFTSPDFRVTTTGTLDVRETSPTTHSFEAHLTREGGATTTIDYVGTVEGDYDVATTWNGSGTATRESVLPPRGTVEAVTVDEVLDDTLCIGQAASGETQITAGGHTATIVYDGATDCDDDQNARWTFDGDDRGFVDGVTCAASAPGAPASSRVVLGVGALALVMLVRRRRPSRSRCR